MNTQPIVPATISLTDDGVPWSPHYADIYHSRAGARTQARHVFLAGNDLPQRWQRRQRFVVLETGFGLGHNFLATWQAWRDDPARCDRLVYVAIERRPCTAPTLRSLHDHAGTSDELSQRLADAWPPLTHNLHPLSFEDGRVQLLLALGDVQDWLRELVAEVDAFYLDGFSPARNPEMWQPRLCKALARLAAPDASLATWTAASGLRDGLRAAGFEVRKAQGTGGKRDITLARYAPAFAPRRPPARLGSTSSDRHAVIVGAGLAGCATAHALALQGWSSTVIDRHAEMAQETSGNPAGLFHGIVNAQDGTHARYNRAAAMLAQRRVAEAIQRHGVSGSVSGLLRLDDADPDTLDQVRHRLGLPLDYVGVADAARARELSGLRLPRGGWHFPGGGWVHPGGLCAAWLADAAPRRLRAEVASLRRSGHEWHVLDARGAVIECCAVVVLANAHDALRLLQAPAWPVDTIRGQVSFAPWGELAPLVAPGLPIAGTGYLLPDVQGRAVFGATSQPDDADPAVRVADHATNLAQLARLVGLPLAADPARMQGRTGWRCSARDRLPIIGPVPDDESPAARHDQPRLIPRREGLYVHLGLGSRGITWAALGAQALAAWITGAPAPLESSLLDAIDPGRFVSRSRRRPSPTAQATPSATHTPEDG